MGTLLLALALAAGMQFHQNFEKAVLTLSGAGAIEELDESELDHYQFLTEHPLDLNSVGRSRLAASGLLSSYQIAALLDYRRNSGDVLSYSELSLIDGFSPALAEALRPFTTLKTVSAPGHNPYRRASGSLATRASVREKDGKRESADGAKLHLEVAERAELNWATRTTYSSKECGFGNLSAAYYGKKSLGRLVIGNFGARFGQGLALWSGFSMSGVSSVAAFRRNGSGISASSSYTSSLLGIGSEWRTGSGTISCAFAWPGELICNWSLSGRQFTAGTSGIHDFSNGRSVASIDARAGFKNISLFGEVAVERKDGQISPAVLAGAIYSPKYGNKFAILGRWYSPAFSGAQSGAVHSGTRASDEAGLSVGMQLPWLDASADAAVHPAKGSRQIKSILRIHKDMTIGEWLGISPEARVCIRASDSGVRSELRGELGMSAGPWRLSARANALWNKDFAWLWFAEAGVNAEHVKSYLRFTLFKIDNWDDRIYVYERDIPGSFSIPAYYGRGFNLSWSGSAKLRTHRKGEHQLAFRASASRYPWTLNGRTATSEIKLMYRASR